MSQLPRFLYTSPLPGLHRPLVQAEGDSISKYLDTLIKWQSRHRLIGSVDPAWMVENIVLDSLAFLEVIPSGARLVADLGSGAGIPGIPLAIVRPDMEIDLIEARERRVSFLSTVVRELSLPAVSVIARRAESLGNDYMGRFDVVVMRCAGSADAVIDTALRLVKPGGQVIASSSPELPVPVEAEAVLVRKQAGEPRTFHRYIKRPM